MLITTIRNSFFIALVSAIAFLMSGCTTTTSSVAISKVEKDFKNDFDVNILRNAIASAADEKNWKVIDQTSTSMSLKKTYQKVKVMTNPSERWKRVTENNDVYVKVDINEKYFKMNLSDQSQKFLKTDSDRELFNEDLANLEKGIYVKLATTLL